MKKYIGAYAAVLNGVDAIVFTAGLGENSPEMRQAIAGELGYLGAEFDEQKNNVRGIQSEISAPGSKCKIYVIPTNEELMIAQDTAAIVSAHRDNLQ